MKIKKIFGDIIRVSLSNVMILISGILASFLLPKIVGVQDYGYYKTYTLYAVYVGMFHFGICDGIYLKYGGADYDSLDKRKFRYYTQFFIRFEAAVALILVVLSLLFLRGEYRTIFFFLGIYLVFHNITGYYQGISQATGRFKELSGRNMIQAVLVICSVTLMWSMHRFLNADISYRTYIAADSVIIGILTAWYIHTYSNITFGDKEKDSCLRKDILHFVKIGFPLMLANLCSSLIFTIDRQFVNILFGTATYAVYAFAYNMLSLVTTATSAVATVIYPNLKRADANTLKNNYSLLVSVILYVVFGCLLIYFPLDIFVRWYLPKYSGSLEIFRIIFPGLAVSSAVTIVMHNYYKSLDINFQFFIKTVITLGVSATANTIAYIVWKTPASISAASIITMIFWYILTEFVFVKQYHIKWKRNFIYMIVMMAAFYLITSFDTQLLGMVLYLVAFGFITFKAAGKEKIKKLLCVFKPQSA